MLRCVTEVASNLKPAPSVFIEALKACTCVPNGTSSSPESFSQGKTLHSHIIEIGFISNLYINNTLVSLYSKWGLLEDAYSIFVSMSERDIVTWNVMVSGYAKDGHKPHIAFYLLHQMRIEGFQADKFTFVSILKACKMITGSCLGHAKMIHTLIISCHLDIDVYVGSSLIHVYGACHSLLEASKVFDEFPDRNVVMWNAMISVFSDHGLSNEAIQTFKHMQQCKVHPNDATFISILKATSTMGDLRYSRMVHFFLVESIFCPNVIIDTTLVDTYCKCGSLMDAKDVFERLSKDNIVTWSAMLTGYVDHGYENEARILFGQMINHGVVVNAIIFVVVLRACCKPDMIQYGYLIHMLIIQGGSLDEFVDSALINLYVKCAKIDDAYCTFCRFSEQNLASWSSMIEGYTEHGCETKAIALFQKMIYAGENPNSVIFLSVFKACSNIHDLKKCISFHVQVIENGFWIDPFVGNTLIDMYAKCGSISKALEVFNKLPKKSVMTWNALISGYVYSGDGWEALCLYEKMQAENIDPNSITFSSIIKACCISYALEEGKIIHFIITHHNLGSDIFLKSALIDLYAKNGCCEDACMLFDKSVKHELVPCNVMMRGYVHHGQFQDALKVFSQIGRPASKPDSVMFVNLLQACSSTGAHIEGKLVHLFVLDSGCESSLFIGNALIDMYSKCGSIRDALKVFSTLESRDIVSWSAMIAGFSWNGDYDMAFRHLMYMQQDGFKPNEVTFISLFSFCSQIGFVSEASRNMDLMRELYYVQPTMDHYNVMVDALGRAGFLKEADDLIQTVPFAQNLVGWASLLSHCNTHCNTKLGKHSFNHFITFDSTHASGYMHMAIMCMKEEDM